MMIVPEDSRLVNLRTVTVRDVFEKCSRPGYETNRLRRSDWADCVNPMAN